MIKTPITKTDEYAHLHFLIDLFYKVGDLDRGGYLTVPDPMLLWLVAEACECLLAEHSDGDYLSEIFDVVGVLYYLYHPDLPRPTNRRSLPELRTQVLELRKRCDTKFGSGSSTRLNILAMLPAAIMHFHPDYSSSVLLSVIAEQRTLKYSGVAAQFSFGQEAASSLSPVDDVKREGIHAVVRLSMRDSAS